MISNVNARRVLFYLWFSCFLLNLAILLYLYLRDWIGPDNFHAALDQLRTSYTPYLGVITLFYFGKKNRNVGTERRKAPFVFAALASIMWNAVIFAFLARLVFLVGTIENSIQEISFLSSWLSWIVAPVIGYYFANSSSQTGSEDKTR